MTERSASTILEPSAHGSALRVGSALFHHPAWWPMISGHADNAWKSGNAAFLRAWVSDYSLIANHTPPDNATKFGVTSLPGGSAGRADTLGGKRLGGFANFGASPEANRANPISSANKMPSSCAPAPIPKSQRSRNYIICRKS